MKRFFGFSERELDEILPDDWEAYLKTMKVINAEETMQKFTVSSFPDLKKKDRQDIARRYRREAGSLAPKKRLSMKEAMEKMRDGGR